MMYISVLCVFNLNLMWFFVYNKLMYYCEFINIFIVLSVKICENAKGFTASILELIKQKINNVLHNTFIKCNFIMWDWIMNRLFYVKKTYSSLWSFNLSSYGLSDFVTFVGRYFYVKIEWIVSCWTFNVWMWWKKLIITVK